MNNNWKCIICGYVHEGEEPPENCTACGVPRNQFVLIAELPDELAASLKRAFAEEAKANARNMAFARRAERDELPQIARLFRAVAEAEKVHAAEYVKFLEGVVGDTGENLEASFENEIKANTESYPPLVKQALDLGREDVAGSFSRARDVEERHAELYKNALNAMMSDEDPEYCVCSICGYVFNAELPDRCPVCRATKENFLKVD